ncbi:outer membrane protein [Pontibaca methylaminivorans]|uniref:Opacity protein n=1 Tax=Pontibaca methylaminivorans TaxID=515897 RepID=A0A1R3WCC3_9RHOB|nr:outer membrane beta-barrel protein [Pontibaca methylaminivorans]SIT74698.1 Opacity protein [Pontibaca methylaminivorans]
MLKRSLLTASTAALIAAGPAFAGNLQEPIVEPVIAQPVQVQPISDWTGFYLGAQAGYGTSDIDNFDLEPDGALGGVHVGYLYDLGQWVVGGELDYDWADMKDSFTDIEFGSIDAKIDNIARAKALVGYDLGDGLLYGTVGAFRAETSISNGIDSFDDTDNGWLAGIGYKHKFTENWIGGVEALYHSGVDFLGVDGLDTDITTITARISYKF